MAGPIRQPIDIPSLERYLVSKTDIQTPLDVKQVNRRTPPLPKGTIC